jgi:trimethylamine:corrinoid methyltransferase-like protein
VARLTLGFLSPGEIRQIHDTSMRILARIGLKVPSQEVLDLLIGQEGVSVDRDQQVVTLDEAAVMTAVAQAPNFLGLWARQDRQAHLWRGRIRLSGHSGRGVLGRSNQQNTTGGVLGGF